MIGERRSRTPLHPARLKEKYEIHHGVRITDGALVAASLKKAVKGIGKHPSGDFEEGLVRARGSAR